MWGTLVFIQPVLGMGLEMVTVMWNTSGLVLIPKKDPPTVFNDYTLTSHVMKTLARLVISHLRPPRGP